METSTDRGLSRRHVLSVLVSFAAAVVLAGCASGADSSASPATPASTTISPAPTTTTTVPTATTTVAAPLIAPSVIASAEPQPEPFVPTVTTAEVEVPTVPYVAPPSVCIDCGIPEQPSEPATPPPDPVDAQGFPLGTTCGPVSCTSPGGLIFVNPDAVPGLGNQGFDLCDRTYCVPPGFQIVPDQLPGTGSSGGAAN